MILYFKIKRNLFPSNEHWPDFIPQFRLESRCKNPDDKTALEMRTADPLWMLGRQWQFGEFRGEDNGSPIGVKANYRTEKVSQFSFPNMSQREDLGNIPVEARVEAIAVKPTDLRSKVRIGQKMEELIEANFTSGKSRNFIRNLRGEFPLTVTNQLDEKSRRFFHFMRGKVIDGGDLWEKIQKNDFPYASFEPLEETTEQLKNWYQELFFSVGEESAWQSKHLHHQFELHGENDVRLNAPDYQSGHLDWYSFDHATIGIDPAEQAIESEELIPTNVSFAAMPDKRLFSFEDSKLDLAGMQVETNDLMRLMIIDFSLISGSDWFTIPLKMEPGELCWINHLQVTDVFGVTTTIKNSEGQFLGTNPLKVWDAFKVRDKEAVGFEAAQHFLYLPSATTNRQESVPLEEILFLRDEYANMVWGIEKTVQNEMGKPSNGFDLHLELNGPFVTEKEKEENQLPVFRLATPVPTNWIPYVPTHEEGSNNDIELKRAVMMRNETGQEPEDIEPISMLAQHDLSTIREEAIPRAGVRIQLTRQRVRWTDGKTYIWLGRKVLAGKGEGSSGLTFDQVK